MIGLGINLRDEFKNKVKNFCSDNNIEWSDNIYTESMNSEGVVGTPEQVICVLNLVNCLEEKRRIERKNKSFWWRLWN